MYKIRKYGDPVLKQKCQQVIKIDAKIREIIENMIDIMYKESGVGLAASQIGISKRIAVIDVAREKNGKSILILINPEIVESEGQITAEEGCLSFIPEIKAEIKRASKVTVKAMDINGKEFIVKASGLLCRALQHEIDHLDGILIVDRMGFSQKTAYIKQMRKAGL